MRKLLFLIFPVVMIACSENVKDFSSVKVGMSSRQVLQHAGQPDKKQDLGIADLWVYEQADRTVVFRKDTVYDIITSSSARIDSIQTSLDKIGDKVEKQAEKAGEKLDSLGRKLKDRLN